MRPLGGHTAATIIGAIYRGCAFASGASSAVLTAHTWIVEGGNFTVGIAAIQSHVSAGLTR